MKGKILSITYRDAVEFLTPRHYSGRKPNVKYAFGWYYKEELVAVVTFGKPASNSLCEGVCGKELSNKVYELNRLCRVDNWEEPLSAFVGACLRRLSSENLIIVSYSDTAMNHSGYIYQALNFIYTGCTKRRTDKYTPGRTHSRHYDKNEKEVFRKIRSAKHRYIYFCTKNKRIKKRYMESLKYHIETYPKGDNSKYKLGEYLEPEIYKIQPNQPDLPDNSTKENNND